MRIILTSIILTALTGGLILAGSTRAGKVKTVREEPTATTSVEQGKQDERLVANKVTVEADRLKAQGTAESLRKAIEKYLEALPLWQALEEQVKEVQILNEIGVTYWSLGEPLRALDYYAKALSLSRAI